MTFYLTTSISILSIQLDRLLAQMIAADIQTLDSDQVVKARAEGERNAAAAKLEHVISDILTLNPQNTSENAIQAEIWADYADDIIGTIDPVSPLNGLHLCVNFSVSD